MFESLLQTSYFALFLIISLGFILGRIKIKGLSLDVSAVIFIALLFGHFGVTIPKALGDIGLVLFIFTIGIQAGPGFFDSFRSKGKTLIILALLIVGSASITGIIFKYALGIDTPSIVGLIAGALTSTPGLAVAIDTTQSSSALFVKLLPKLLRIDVEAEARKLEIERRGQFPELNRATFRVENQKVIGKSIAQLQFRNMTGAVVSRIKHGAEIIIPTAHSGAVVSRIKHGAEIIIPTAHSVLKKDDLIRVVGNDRSFEQVKLLIGEQVDEDIPFTQTQELQSLLLTNKNIIGHTLGELNLQSSFGCTVTRVRRSGIDLIAEPNLALKFGDKLMVAGEKQSLEELSQYVGNDEKKLSDTDFFPIAMGIVLGVLFGKLSLSFSDSFSFSPGLTGGILMVALILSAIGKTGPIIWSMSGPANQLLRQLGLLFFLSEVGTSAGSNLVATFQESGWTLFGVGMAITLVPMIVALVFGYWVFKINILDLLGTIASSAPSIAYATVYPIAMVFLILFIQFIAGVI